MTQKSSSVTIRDVAREAGVSIATVSRYINHNAPISTEVAERLERVMEELEYVPHSAARHLATRKTFVIGVLLTNMQSDFFTPLLNGIESAVRGKGYNMIVATYRAGNNGESGKPPIGPHNVDGLLVFADSLNDGQLSQLSKRKFPVVLIHRSSPKNLSLPYITVENKMAAEKLIDHLIEVHGRRRIIFLRGPLSQEDSYWRECGYKASLKAHHISYDPDLILEGDFERDIAYRQMKKFLASPHPEFDAVFGGADEAAIGAIMALQEAGFQVPEQVSVVGFDDLKQAASINPSLTTVHAPTESVGRESGERLFSILEGLPVNQVTLLPTDVIFRRSCGCMV